MLSQCISVCLSFGFRIEFRCTHDITKDCFNRSAVANGCHCEIAAAAVLSVLNGKWVTILVNFNSKIESKLLLLLGNIGCVPWCAKWTERACASRINCFEKKTQRLKFICKWWEFPTHLGGIIILLRTQYAHTKSKQIEIEYRAAAPIFCRNLEIKENLYTFAHEERARTHAT